MSKKSAQGRHVFLTGVTGFVGKVVLEGLLRRSEALDIAKIYLLIRPSKKISSPQERFDKEVAASPCFSHLPPDWTEHLEIIAGDLVEKDCGLSVSDRNLLRRQVNYIINCAASVEFDLPVAEAAQANITSSLNVLEFAKTCPGLKQMLNVSTAYVTPHSGDHTPILEKLAPLPRPAAKIYQDILSGRVKEAALLDETGHPNTYTFTKCLAEHLLIENKGSVPLSILRPSIVSASWQYPFPGWIDSHAAFAGFVALIGMGYLRAVIAQYRTQLDVVPCDEVAERIIDCTFLPKEKPDQVHIVHAVAGKKNSCNIRTCIRIIEDYFRRYPVQRFPDLNYVGNKNIRFLMKDLQHHRVPFNTMSTIHGLTGEKKSQSRVKRLKRQVLYLNKGFPYFTHKSFDFRSSMPIKHPDFYREVYIETVCRGVYRHLMRKNDREVVFAGEKHRGFKPDLPWAAGQEAGTFGVRSSAYFVRKALRRCTPEITFDRYSFEQTLAQIPPDTLKVVIPTHRSYLDFILCSYLFFAYPELGVDIPNIAAAEEFSRIPVLGWLFKQTKAFYVTRGLGKENPALTKKVHSLLQQGETLEFFIEGTRSRSRRMLPPRRGMIRCLQAAGETCTILPLSISYDIIPEEGAYMHELRGEGKPTMRLKPLLKWFGNLFSGKIRLGRIHLACGSPVVLDENSDLNQVSHQVMAELQSHLVCSTYHLENFLLTNPNLNLSLDWLKQAIVARGGTVLTSSLKVGKAAHPLLERCLRYQWIHHFYPDIHRLFPEHPAVQSHLRTNGFAFNPKRPSPTRKEDPRLKVLLRALFEPICRDYQLLAEMLGAPPDPLPFKEPREVVKRFASAYLPNIEDAWQDLIQREILQASTGKGAPQWGPQAEQIEAYREEVAWPERGDSLAAAG